MFSNGWCDRPKFGNYSNEKSITPDSQMNYEYNIKYIWIKVKEILKITILRKRN